jgi:hypothetical protein
MGKLSHTLIDYGFFSALGTTEREGLPGQRIIERGTPKTWDRNNGVFVVNDEIGRPWIVRVSITSIDIIETLNREFPLQQGANVPHSNDGGHFVRCVLPILMNYNPQTMNNKQHVDEVIQEINRRTFGEGG